MTPERRRFRWRDYRTAAGTRPVKDFLEALTDEEAAEFVAAMREVAALELATGRHLRGDVYEHCAESDTRSFRLLFAKETKFVLLSLAGFAKKTQRTPSRELELAERRLRDWRSRAP